MNATHTPGPWIKDGNKVYGPKDPRSKHKNGRMFVAEVPSESSRSSPHCDNGCADQQAELDARLIAAAPELLVALDCLQELALSVIGNRDNGSDFDRAMDSLAREAEAAVEVICKAKGIANEVAREDDRC